MMEENNQTLNTEVSNQNEVAVDTQQPDTKTFTQEELNSILEKRLERETKKWEAKFNAIEEAQKLSQLSDEQKAEYDYTKKLDDLTKREQELESKIQAYNQQQYKATIQSQLGEAGLPGTLADMLVSFDAETVSAKINELSNTFNSQLNAQLEQRVKSTINTPVVPEQEAKLLSIDEIAKMTPQEIMKNKAEVDKAIKEYYKTK